MLNFGQEAKCLDKILFLCSVNKLLIDSLFSKISQSNRLILTPLDSTPTQITILQKCPFCHSLKKMWVSVTDLCPYPCLDPNCSELVLAHRSTILFFDTLGRM